MQVFIWSVIASVSNHMPTYWLPLRCRRWPRRRLCIACMPPDALPLVPYERHVKHTYSSSLHHAASHSSTPPGQAIGYNSSSFNRFFGFEFRFWKNRV